MLSGAEADFRDSTIDAEWGDEAADRWHAESSLADQKINLRKQRPKAAAYQEAARKRAKKKKKRGK